ncbi:serine/threonine protein kinase [Luteolibacter yonseiensis]|uniref:Serine/threonine protein kinase n=1 Tax=Luteolibacter yonseiensis TaxID=1144680 RepID=A0A934VCM3_9BACT|nr:serine/threonine-protein kinase [Luteolibacter yonseiensis]MBK1816639.1 serine/threonine protein kinase [Luteolibacter yonseiensis]
MTPSIDKLLFTAASHFVEAAERRTFLEFACKGDVKRLRQIEELLAISQDAEEFFDLQGEETAPVVTETEEVNEGSLGARIGPYRLIDRLGSGGCGVVYLAEQQVPVKRRVALKIIRLGMNTENVISRFNLEREALALMDHPNIARVLDAGATASGLPYFVMELVDGERITEFCDQKRLGLRARLELFILVCEAIQHAHQKGVIHRDIKPSNVLVRTDDGRAVPKVIDFGIAKATAGHLDVEATVTNFGQFIGTPAYMSPEQAAGGTDIDTRSDIYSLGALLCELLSGSPPIRFEHFNERSEEEIRSMLRDGDTGMPSAKLREISKDEVEKIAGDRGVDPQRLPALLAGDLDWIVMKALEKERPRRYETANGLALDVQRYLNEEPVLARPPSRRYLLTKMIRRNRIKFVAASIALFGLLGGFGVSTWLFFRERDAREEQARLRVVAEHARANEVHLREMAEAADLMNQAAVFLKYRDIEQADNLVRGITPERVPRSLESAATLKAVANWNLEQKRWKEAAQRFNLLGHVLTSVDMSDSDQISFSLLPALTAVSEWGEPGQYDQLRLLTIKRFEKSANPVVTEQIIKGALLEPADPKILEQVQPLAKVVSTSLAGPKRESDAHNIAWRQFSLALLAYREGRLTEAGDWARRSLATNNQSDTRAVSNRIILAMVDAESGRITEARSALEDARKQVDQWAESPFQVTNADRTLWYNWGATRILLKQAEKMSGN